MIQEIAEIDKAANLLREVAKDNSANARDRMTCQSAAMVLGRIATRLRQEAPLYVPAAKFTGARIIKIIQDQEVA